MRDILISTAGTSLKGNIKRDGDEALQKYLDSGKISQLADSLCRFNDTDRLCGAEINSVAGILSQKLLHERFLHMILVSDTEDGALVGEILRHYYLTRHNKQSRFTKVEVNTITGLTSKDAALFKHQGLKNLVRLIASTVRASSPDRIIINATGGYKAQISFAGMVGQALNIPVCYMFEGFNEVITLPPQPVSFDFDFWLRHYDLFCRLDQVMVKDVPWQTPDERFNVLVTSLVVDGRHLYELTPAGQLFHETFKYRFRSRAMDLLPSDSLISPEDRKITYEDKNSNKHRGLNHYLEKIIAAPFVNSIYTHYYNPALEKKTPL